MCNIYVAAALIAKFYSLSKLLHYAHYTKMLFF